MTRWFRQVLDNINLTKDEATILHKSELIIKEAIDNVLEYKVNGGEIDDDLLEVLNTCINGMQKCYSRINVHIMSELEEGKA